MKPKKVNGRLILQEIKFEQYLEKKVIVNNKTSSKVTLPKDWEGKKVCIVLLEE